MNTEILWAKSSTTIQSKNPLKRDCYYWYLCGLPSQKYHNYRIEADSALPASSPVHVCIELSGSMIPVSKAISEEMILNVEHGELCVWTSSWL